MRASFLLCWLWLQCVARSAPCDKIEQCLDGSDEQTCPPSDLKPRHAADLPMLVEFDKTQKITRTSLNPETGDIELEKTGEMILTPLHFYRGSTDTSCPETHFWCRDKDYCLPVFVLCNGYYDCPDHEDEEGCDLYTCPGFYRCRASKICLHVTHVCDDWPLCPQQDDELLCGLPCPADCTCHGLAFFCNRAFAAHRFPDVKYLDVRGSGMLLHDFGDNHMLVHLGLAKCGVRTMSTFTFHNLRSLDLSDNMLTELSFHHFGHMPQLTVLFLAGNPLSSVLVFPSNSSSALHEVNRLDLSRIKTHYIGPNLFSVFPKLQVLNLSHSGVEPLLWNSIQMPVVSLRELDMRGSVVGEFPRDALRGFLQLRLLHTDDFKLCCPSVLPPGFDLHHCHVTPDDVSSCDRLLGSLTYRSTVAVLATLALLGNVASLTVRVCVGSTWRLSSGGVVLTHLSVADLGTGLYLATLGLADHLLAGHYVWQDNTWRRGAVCHLAGVLAMSCRHAATFFIAILALQRCLHCGLFGARSLPLAKVKIACAIVWIISFPPATFLVMSQRQFSGKHALCVPLLHKKNGSEQSHHAYVAIVLVHFVTFSLCSVFEVVSGISSRKTNPSIMSKGSRTKDLQFVVLGSLASGFLYTMACLVPTDSQTDRQRAVHTALVYFSSVVSSAANPFLHLYGVRAERSRRTKEERLMKIVNRARVRV